MRQVKKDSYKLGLYELKVLPPCFADGTFQKIGGFFFLVVITALFTHHYMATTGVDHGGLGTEAEFALLFAVVLGLVVFGLLGFGLGDCRLVDGASVGDVVVVLGRLKFLWAFLFGLRLLYLIFVEGVGFKHEFELFKNRLLE